MVYTVTFNPAIDYVVNIDNLDFGRTNRSESEEYYFGGKGINVSLMLSNLGIDTKALGFAAGFTGKEIIKGIEKAGIKTDFIFLEKGISRINIKIKAKDETEINCQGPKISQSDIEKLLKKLSCINPGDTLVLAGSIPNNLPKNTYEKIIRELDKKKIYFVVDASKDLLLNTLKHHPFLIKPNNQELGEIFNTEIHKNDEEKIIRYAKELQKKGAVNVLVSLADMGSILLDEYGKIHKVGIIPVETVNSVGAGDSMVAGFIAGYSEKRDYSYALKLGSICGAATACSKGIASKEKTDELFSRNNFKNSVRE